MGWFDNLELGSAAIADTLNPLVWIDSKNALAPQIYASQVRKDPKAGASQALIDAAAGGATPDQLAELAKKAGQAAELAHGGPLGLTADAGAATAEQIAQAAEDAAKAVTHPFSGPLKWIAWGAVAIGALVVLVLLAPYAGIVGKLIPSKGKA